MEIEFALLRSNADSYVSQLPCELIKYIIALQRDKEQWIICEHPLSIGYRIIYHTYAYDKIDCIISFMKRIIGDSDEYLCLSDWVISKITGLEYGTYDDIKAFTKRHLQSNDGIRKYKNILEISRIKITNKIEKFYYNKYMDIEFALLRSKPDSFVSRIPDDLVRAIISYIHIERLYILKHNSELYYSTFAFDINDFITKYLIHLRYTWFKTYCCCLSCFIRHEDVILSDTPCRICLLSERTKILEKRIDSYLRDIPSFISDFNKNLTDKGYSISTN